MLVTKDWSVPTLSTAFWLLSAATRGLDNTWTAPWVSRKVIRAAKFFVWNARPNRDAAGLLRFSRLLPGIAANEPPVADGVAPAVIPFAPVMSKEGLPPAPLCSSVP